MEITPVGIAVCLIGLLVILRGTLNHVFMMLIVTLLFGGTAAIQVEATGSSILPFQLALIFAAIRIAFPVGGYLGAVPQAISANLPLVMFTIFGVVSAYVGPRLFAGTINVVPMQAANLRYLLDSFPLQPSGQNITTAIYLTGALLTALIAYIACSMKGGALTLIKGAIIVSWLHVVVGIISVALLDTPGQVVLDFFQNAQYAQLDHQYQNFIRIRGFFAETSGYSALAFALLVLMCECWYRNLMPRSTGPAAIGLFFVLFFSTSSTAYVGMACYAAFFFLRLIMLPLQNDRAKLQVILLAIFSMIFAVAVTLVFKPDLVDQTVDMLLHMTVDKEDSNSGQQRTFWAMQGWYAFLHSYGLGIGAGSFRSSSIFMAILGSMGVVGIATFLAYMWKAVQPLRQSTWTISEDLGLTVGGATACAALFAIVPAAIGAPGPVPDSIFVMLAGASIALRRLQPEQRGFEPVELVPSTSR